MCEECGGGVWDGVVDVEDVELVCVVDFGYFDGKWKCVVGVFEEVVVVDVDWVEKEMWCVGWYVEWVFVVDEVDFVVEVCEFFVEGGGEDVVVVDGWVVGDVDFEWSGSGYW